MNLTRSLRVVAALSALIAGYAHLKLYNDGYKDVPVGNIGTQFLLNALTAVVIAAGLLAPLVLAAARKTTPPWLTAGAPLLGVGWAAMSLFAFWMSRTSSGWMGFQDGPGLNPAPEAALSVFSELVVLACCALLLATFFVQRSRAEGATAR